MRHILIGAVFFATSACVGAKLPSSAIPPSVLTKPEIDQLKRINQVQSDALEAARVAFSTTSPSNDHVGEMVKLIKAGGCAQKLVAEDGDLTRSWQAEWRINGDACPLTVDQTSAFDLTKAQWNLIRNLSSRSDDFKKLSMLDGISMTGTLTVKRGSKGEKSVNGKFLYQPFSVGDLGPVRAEIKIAGSSIYGDAFLTLQFGMTVKLASYRWNSLGRFFAVDGVQMDEKAFGELFSSFELTEIMDRAAKMM